MEDKEFQKFDLIDQTMACSSTLLLVRYSFLSYHEIIANKTYLIFL